MRRIMLAVMLGALTACGGATSGTGTDSTGATAPSAVASTAPVPSASATSAAAPVAEASALGGSASGNLATGGTAGGSIEAQASSMLARQLNTTTESLKLISKEQTEWSDGSLGCPKPDMMYTQAIVPGYKLTYNDGARAYDVHTPRSGTRARP